MKYTFLPVATLSLVMLFGGIQECFSNEKTEPVVTLAESSELKVFKAAIRAQYDLKIKSFAAKDASDILEKFYTADVIATGQDQQVMIGREAIRPLYNKLVQDFDVEIESIYPHVRGDLGWDWANFKVIPRDLTQKPFTVRILFLWEKHNGQWMSKGDIYVVGDMHDVVAKTK